MRGISFMNPERWQRIAELYESASARAPEDRAALLKEACGEDLELFRDVESLLRQDATGEGLLESIANRVNNGTSRSSLPQNFGRYRVLDLIGEGGMGAVYKAEQEHPRRTVALKVIKSGFASPTVLRRFEQESQVLGRLQHPGIAQIYEAGTADGGLGPQPFFAMEFINGLSLLDYAKTHSLNAHKRLQLVAKICDAVQHAHGRGIIHRDLKPTNILVDDTGQPKVLDFGVAHVTDADARMTGHTNLGELIGTLAYMSPEQVLGDPLELDARSDVYALGVILYELLAGCLPYNVSGRMHEAVQKIREQPPRSLGEINRTYRGDLETIVAKTLDKDKRGRYASAADLASDLRRYMSSEPILARPPSLTYQMKKLAVRHRALTGAVLVVVVVLTAGIVVSTREAIRADRAERAALIERDRATTAERNANAQRDRALTAEDTAKKEQTRAEQQETRALQASNRADVEAATANAVSEFLQKDLLAQASTRSQAGPTTKPDPNLTIRAALDRAAARIGGQFASQPLVEASIRYTIATTYSQLSLYPEARAQAERAFYLRRNALGSEHPDTLDTMELLGVLDMLQGDLVASETRLTTDLELRRKTGAGNELKTLGTIHELANTLKARGEYARAEAMHKRALEGYTRALGEKNPDTLAIMNNLAADYSDQGKYAQAEQLSMKVSRIKETTLGPENPSTLLSMNNLAVAYRNEGKYAEAETILTKVYEARRRNLGDEHLDTFASENSMALLYQAEGKYEQAESFESKLLGDERRVLGSEHPETLRTMNNLAEIYHHQNRLDESESLFGKVLELRRRVLGPTHPNTINVLSSLGELKLERHEYDAAEPLLREAFNGYEKTNSDSWRRYYAESMLGAALMDLRKYADAEPLLALGYRGMQERRSSIPFENQSSLKAAREWLAKLYQSQGKQEQAAKLQ